MELYNIEAGEWKGVTMLVAADERELIPLYVERFATWDSRPGAPTYRSYDANLSGGHPLKDLSVTLKDGLAFIKGQYRSDGRLFKTTWRYDEAERTERDNWTLRKVKEAV